MLPRIHARPWVAALLVLAASTLAAAQEITPSRRASDEELVSASGRHRVLLEPQDPRIASIAALGAARFVADYGSFSLFVVDETALGGPEAIRALSGDDHVVRDDFCLVEVNGYAWDGSDVESIRRAFDSIDPALVSDPTPPSDAGSRLLVVQFQGPVKDEWLAAIRGAGAFVVTTLQSNAYVVKCDPIANAAVERLASEPFVLRVVPFAPALKLRPSLRPPRLFETQLHDVTVQVIADGESADFIAALQRRSAATVEMIAPPCAVLSYLDIGLRVDSQTLIELARDPHVFAIEETPTRRLLRDERQGQIEVGNVNGAGTQPAGPNYLAWLTSKGFPGAAGNPFPFVVDVTDDGIDKGTTTPSNLEFKVSGQGTGASRLAYAFNYTADALADGKAGHGNINASIIGGWNTAIGSAFEDSLGYNYGLGIAPWVKLGNSKVFSNTGAGGFLEPTTKRLQKAYKAGARISNNSWGATAGTDYDADSQAHDAVVRDADPSAAGNQEITILFAAGNDGPGASTVHAPATAKNVITVGASENYRPTGSDGCGTPNSGADNALDMTTFSSHGPTGDGRKKPDLVAPGSHIQGAASQAAGYDGTGVCDKYWPVGQQLYAWSSGTSHSTPGAAGAAALLRQWSSIRGNPPPSPALVKAILMNGVRYLSGNLANDKLWSNSQGMGRIDLSRAFDDVPRIAVDESKILGATGEVYALDGTIADSAQPFRVTLAWTDAPGPTTGNAYVNNLDLRVTVNGTTYRGNVFATEFSKSGGTADARNNVESVFLPIGTTGPFSISVRAANLAGDGVPGNTDLTDQDFALFVYNGTSGALHPDFSIVASPAAESVTVGGSTTFAVSAGALYGFAGSVSLAASPTISGVTYSWNTASVAAGGTATLTVSASSTAPLGPHTITLTGTSGAVSHATTVDLSIVPVIAPNAVRTYSAAPHVAIPDDDATGVTSKIDVADDIKIASIAVTPSITHAYKGDLNVTLIGPDGTSVPLHDQTGGAADDVKTTYSIATPSVLPLTAFVGHSTKGKWSLRVKDLAAGDIGTLDDWAITFNGEKSATVGLDIPDNSAIGVTSKLNFAQLGTVATARVRVKILHPHIGDLVVKLTAPDGTAVTLHNKSGGATDDIDTEYPDLTASAQPLSAFVGKSIQGDWKLTVQDLVGANLGVLSNWTLSLTTP